MGLLDGKVAVITGAGSGMAKASTKVFVREGAKVVAADISGAEKDTAAEVGEAVLAVHCDVTREEDVAAAMQTALERFGRLDAVLNVAGIGSAGAHGRDDGHYDTDHGRGPPRGAPRNEARDPGDAADRTGGAIINWSSVGGLNASVATSVYSAARPGSSRSPRRRPSSTGRRAFGSTAICPGSS